MWTDKSLGKVVRGIPALVNLMEYIEQRSASIYVRDYLDGKLGTHALSDLPASRALHWAFEFLRNCTIPVPVSRVPDTEEFDIGKDEAEEGQGGSGYEWPGA